MIVIFSTREESKLKFPMKNAELDAVPRVGDKIAIPMHGIYHGFQVASVVWLPFDDPAHVYVSLLSVE